jgi:precorrin-2 dehydrogenase/sirohydrochlorin ferrochelatase
VWNSGDPVLPIAIDVSKERIVIVGRGRPGQQRYELARASGCERIALFAIDQDGWACYAEAHVIERLPEPSEFAGARIVFIAGLERDISETLAKHARAAGALVNVEDVMDLCEFHVPAIVRRGDLLVAVSTGGQVPGLAQRLKSYIGSIIGVEWEARVRTLAEARASWRRDGVPKDDVIRRTAELIEREKWLPERVS